MKIGLLLLVGLASAAPPPSIKWIAHRGGVVEARFSENSPGSLEAAVSHGYWMIESDIRETRDGRIITQHDPTFMRFYGDPRKVTDLTLTEVRELRATPGGTPPMTFRELIEACRGRLRLMLDVKEPEHSPEFYGEIEQELRRAGMLESTYLIGLDSARRYFKGKLRISANLDQLKEALSRGESVDNLYFLFEWGKTLQPEHITLAQKMSVPVVPSVNTFHYGQDPTESIRLGSEDIRKLRQYGVTEFQIDSVYEPAFRD